MKMYCGTNQFPELKCVWRYKKSHGARGIGKNYHICFDPKVVYDTYAIRRIPCDGNFCAYIIDKPWISGLPAQQQPCYQPVKYFQYWPVLGSFNNWNIIKLSHKATSI